MPQASDELRNEMDRRFGDPISDYGPMNYLKSKGWTLTKAWLWVKPGVHIYQAPRDEFECILFLIHEWDFNDQYPSHKAS